MVKVKILSWDVGIKNLAYCLIEKDTDTKSVKILDWNSIDLLEEKRYKCEGLTKKTKTVCGKKATLTGFYNDKQYFYCGTHKTEFKPEIDETFEQLELSSICNSCGKKAVWLKDNKIYCNLHKKKCLADLKKSVSLKSVKKINSMKSDIQCLALSMYNKLDEILNNQDQINTVYIENQPGLKNPTMKTVSVLLYSYFIERGVRAKKVENVKFVLASNKLKVDLSDVTPFVDSLLLESNSTSKVVVAVNKLIETHFIQDKDKDINKDKVKKQLFTHLVNKKSKVDYDFKKISKDKKMYEITKLLSICYTKFLLVKGVKDDERTWLNRLNQKTKQDDMCDAFLQGYYLIK